MFKSFIPYFQVKSSGWLSRLHKCWMKSVKSSRLSVNVSKRLVPMLTDYLQMAKPACLTPEAKFICFDLCEKRLN